ncbi:MAG: MBL fold metallo-hydrolase, partial [Taibaiella sp.]|nr:MBL fold metallo-hydrolase [Taibaiella sp.]
IEIGWRDVPYLLSQMFKRDGSRRPATSFPVLKIDSLDVERKPDSITRLTWFGHSAFLVEISGKKILLDPMFGPVPAPHPMLGGKRFSDGLPIEIEKLPQIDAIIMSHDHYDHLDYGSIMKLMAKTKEFYMPLGVGAHFRRWGVSAEKIHELDWWQEIRLDSLVFACTPARHFSGRGFGDRAATLWASWVIIAPGAKIYFIGDSGYGPHFRQIGEKYGGFDFAMLECGQYGDKWKAIHMTPEETIQATIDVQAKAAMPIHWAAFTLAFHSWTDPVIRATKKAEEMGVPFYTPQIGQPVVLEEEIPSSRWWEQIR